MYLTAFTYFESSWLFLENLTLRHFASLGGQSSFQ